MEVLVVSHLYPSPNNKANGPFVHRQVRELSERGHDIRIISPRPWVPPLPKLPEDWAKSKSVPSHYTIDGIDVRVPRYLSPPSLQTLALSSFSARWRVARATLPDDFEPDLVHAHVALPDGFAAAALAERMDVPLVTSIHGADFYSYVDAPGCQYLIQKVLDFSATVTVNSTTLRNVGNEYFEYDPVIVPNGVPIDEIDSAKSKDVTVPDAQDRHVLVSLGFLKERKQQELVIRALDVLDRDDFHYVVIGDGPQREELERLATELGVADQVSFLGYIDSHQRVYAHLWNADVFVLPSYDEAFGVAFIEAMACELPVVARAGEGPEDFVTDDETGYFIGRDADAMELAKLLSTLLDSPEERTKVGERAREIVKNEYTWESNAKKIEEAYRSSLGSIN